MQEDVKQEISLLIDDELPKSSALRLFEQIESDEESRAQWDRYNLIGHAIRSGSGILPDVEFVRRVGRALENEPIVFVPARRKAGFRRKAISTALAASIALIAIVALQPWSAPTDRSFGSLALAEYDRSQTNPESSHPRTRQGDPSLNDYLVTHNETTYLVGTPGMLPYARVVTYNAKH